MRVAELFIESVLLSCASASASNFSPLVVGITDCNIIRVMHDGMGEKIRLYGIDAPEKGQAFGIRAKQFVTTLTFGRKVKVDVKDYDRYGRTVADVILPDRRNLNHEIVKAGFVWWYRKYAPRDKVLHALGLASCLSDLSGLDHLF